MTRLAERLTVRPTRLCREPAPWASDIGHFPDPPAHTYDAHDEVGEHTAVLRATWTVTNTTSTGASERRPDIVLETSIPIDVDEIQTVGTG